MKKGDTYLTPVIDFTDTKSNIEALTSPVEGMRAITTDTHESGFYNGSAWVWGSGGSGTVESVTGDGVDNTDPANPVIAFPAPADIGAATSAQGALADSAVQSIVAGTNITVDVTDPANPIVNASGGSSAPATTAANDFQVGDGLGAWVKKTLAEAKTILGVFSDAANDGIYYARKNLGWTNLKTYTDTLYSSKIHAGTHKFLGADEVDIKSSMVFQPSLLLTGTGNASFWTPTLTSGRGSTSLSMAQISASTGTTINDVVGNANTSPITISTYTPGYYTRMMVTFGQWASSNKSEFWVGFFPSSSAFPTTTSHHIGFRVLETAGAGNGKATLYASCGNGTTGIQTSIGTNLFPQYAVYKLGFLVNGTANYFYLNGALVATHTQALNTGMFFGIWAKTGEAVSKIAYSYAPTIMQG